MSTRARISHSSKAHRQQPPAQAARQVAAVAPEPGLAPQLAQQRVTLHPHLLTPQAMIQLQQTIGNRAVQRLLVPQPSHRLPATVVTYPNFDRWHEGVMVQRRTSAPSEQDQSGRFEGDLGAVAKLLLQMEAGKSLAPADWQILASNSLLLQKDRAAVADDATAPTATAAAHLTPPARRALLNAHIIIASYFIASRISWENVTNYPRTVFTSLADAQRERTRRQALQHSQSGRFTTFVQKRLISQVSPDRRNQNGARPGPSGASLLPHLQGPR